MIVAPVFLDASIFMYAAGTAHPYKAPCLGILSALEHARFSGAINTEIIQELLYRYSHIGLAEKGLQLCRELLQYPLTILPVTEADARLAVDLFAAHRNAGIRPRDAIHAATMRNTGITHIVSTDTDFDVFPFLTRVDPATYAARL